MQENLIETQFNLQMHFSTRLINKQPVNLITRSLWLLFIIWINRSPFTKDFHGEEHHDESVRLILGNACFQVDRASIEKHNMNQTGGPDADSIPFGIAIHCFNSAVVLHHHQLLTYNVFYFAKLNNCYFKNVNGLLLAFLVFFAFQFYRLTRK